MSLKKRSQEEIQGIVKDFTEKRSIPEIAKKYAISEGAIYRLVQKHHGTFVDEKPKTKKKVKSLEKKIKEQELEIKLLKAALKKS